MANASAKCGEEWACVWMTINGGDYCILHDPDPGKDPDKFGKAIRGVCKAAGGGTKQVELSGVFFPAEWSLTSCDRSILFNSATFFGPVSFQRATFKGNASFRYATFKGEADFGHVTFEKEADFHGAIFEQGAKVNHAKFSGIVNFDVATFKGVAFFWETYFGEKLTFAQTIFQGDAIFSHAIFEKEVHFICPDFRSIVNFSSTFKTRSLLWGDKAKKLFASAKFVSFMSATFAEPHNIQFSNVDFSCCNLVESELRGIDLSGITWPKNGRSIWKRNAIYEYDGATPEALESAYRQIRQSYEDRGNYPEAGDFYYGEMDQKRKRSLLGRYLPSLITIYWLCSGYGQRPVRAGVVLIFLLVGFTGILLHDGMVNVTDSTPFVLNSTLLHNLGKFSSAMWAYSLRVVTFGSPLYIKPQFESGELISTVARILIPVQAALFVLAVNRKFKR